MIYEVAVAILDANAPLLSGLGTGNFVNELVPFDSHLLNAIPLFSFMTK